MPGVILLDRQDAAQRHVFAERHEMRLVVGGEDVAAWRRSPRACSKHARAGSGGGSVRTVPTSAIGARRAWRRRWRARAARIAPEERRRRRPRATARACGGDAAGEAVSASMRRKLAASAAGSFLRVCGIEGCTRRKVMSGDHGAIVPAQAQRAAAAQRQRAGPAAASGAQMPPPGEIAEPRRQRRRQHGEQAQPVDADQPTSPAASRARREIRRPRHSRRGSTESR